MAVQAFSENAFSTAVLVVVVVVMRQHELQRQLLNTLCLLKLSKYTTIASWEYWI